MGDRETITSEAISELCDQVDGTVINPTGCNRLPTQSRTVFHGDDLETDANPSDNSPMQETGKPGKCNGKAATSPNQEYDAKEYLKKESKKESKKNSSTHNYYPMPPHGHPGFNFPMPTMPQHPSIIHQSGSGGMTVVYNTAGLGGVQVGDGNVMYVNSGAQRMPEHKCSRSKPSQIKVLKSKSPINEENMKIIAKNVGKPWMMLGRDLGFSEGELEAIENDYRSHGHIETVYQMLINWKKRVGRKNCTLGTVAEKLVSCGKGDVAAMLVDK